MFDTATTARAVQTSLDDFRQAGSKALREAPAMTVAMRGRR
ncbi:MULTISPECIES: hypothetical protein [unclassified Bradyrhizobium]|nr:MULTISPECIES: hypothetical protein [unclassified Bradyrhizobium]